MSFRRSPWSALILLLPVALVACGAGDAGGSSGGGGGDWYYHFACNGDSECLATNPLGQPSGTIDEGPVESNCTSLQFFRTKFWGSASWDACDHSPTFTPAGQGIPTITGITPTAASPGSQITVTGTNFPTTASDVALSINGVNLPTTSGIGVTTTTITLTIPGVASLSGPITVTTPGGQATSSMAFTILDNLKAVAWSGSKFLAVGDYGTAQTSDDGVHWVTQTTGVNPLIVSLASVAWVGNEFLAGGSNGYILSSPDAVTWNVPFHGGPTFDGIASSGTQIVAAGTQGAVGRSTDGSSWTTSTVTANDAFNAIVWSGRQFVMLGFSIQTSPDGVTWTQRVAPSTPFYGVAWSGTTYVAVGDGGRISTSTDGVTWTPRTSGTTSRMRAVTWFNGLFVAVGAAGTVLTSPDGVTWTSRANGASANLNGVAASSTAVVAVGDRGTTISSFDGVDWTSNLLPPPNGVGVIGTRSNAPTVSWNAVPGATSYVVYASSGAVSKTSYSYRWTTSDTSVVGSGMPTNQAGAWWNFIVTSVNSYGEGPASAPVAHCVGSSICG